ncbi:MAG: alpha/beta hydrolase [Planctomycetota bacterium]|nr:alpha/beta hydrolase [Planctomycetota bacterium]
MHTLAVLALVGALQCTDPPVPPGGFVLDEFLDQPITLSDGETTTASLRMPRDPAGNCGWPLVVFIHGLFGTQNGPANFARDFAEWGYATVTFDVRGHATASGDHTLWGLRERLDVAEIVEWARASFPGQVASDRLGLAGTSQGAILSFDAAAWAGQPIPPNPWTTGTFPDVHAIVVTNLTSDFRATLAPQGSGLHCNIAATLLGSTSAVRFDPGIVADVARSILDDDPALWRAIVEDPQRTPLALVPTITTPVMAMAAWDDYWFPIEPMVAAVEALPPGTPRKLYIGTGGHSTPNTVGEIALRDGWRRLWFDRFLKGEANGIDQGPTVTYSRTPADPDVYLNAQTSWVQSQAEHWPPPGTWPFRLHLRGNGQLSAGAPYAAEAPDTLVQHVAGGFGAAELIATEFRLPQIEPELPRVQLQWTSAPLAGPLLLAGTPQVQLTLDTTDTQWQVAAALWDIDENGNERYVSSGAHFVHPQTGPAPAQVLVQLGSQCYEFAAGHRIAVRVSNVLVHEPPTGQLLRYAPTLADFTLHIRHEPAALSFVEIPVAGDTAIPYGFSQPASAGCSARLSLLGSASVSALDPVLVRADDIIPARDGLMIYGLGPAQSPLGGGNLWVAAPVKRTPLINSGSSASLGACSGALQFDLGPRLRSSLEPLLTPGARLYVQYWYRDPQSPSLTNLTHGLQFSILP